MRRRGFFLSLLLAAFLALPALFVHHRASADDQPAAKKAKAGDKTNPKDITGQWADLLARREKIMSSLDGLNEKFKAADDNGRQKIQADFMRMKAEYDNEIQPGMEKLASAIFEKDPTDSIAPLVILGIKVKAQKYAEAVALLN